jgi:chromosome segregation ATPase
MQDGHALLNTTMDALLDKTQQLHDLMARTQAQEQLLTELTELGAASEGAQKELAEDSSDQQSIQAASEQLIQQSQRLQERLEALQLNHQDLLAQDARHRGLCEQYRGFFDTLQYLKLDNLRLAEKVRTQEPQLEGLQQAKTRLENEFERLKGVEEAH